MIIAISIFVLMVFNFLYKKNKILFILSLSLMWCIMTFISGNADEGVYLSRFFNANEWLLNSELLFQLLNVICYKIGLTFVEYKGVLAFIYILLFGSTIWKLSKYPNIVLSLFFLCPFTLHASQLRFALASAIFAFGYKYLFIDYSNEEKKRFFYPSDLKFLLLIVIATFIHTVSLFWLSLLLIRRLNIKQTVLMTALISLFIYFIFNPNTLSLLFTKIGAYERINAYFSVAYQQSEFRRFGATAVTVAYIGLLSIVSCILLRRGEHKHSKPLNELLKINIFMLVVMSFIFRYTREMYRPQEGVMLLNYIVLYNEIPRKNVLKLKANKTDILTQLLLFSMIFGAFVLKVLLYNCDTVWKPMFFI